MKMKFYWYIAAFLFERYEIKEIGRSFKIPLLPYCFKFKF